MIELEIHANFSSSSNPAAKPEVIQPLNNQIAVPEGKTLVIHCKARGRPQPKIRWLKNQRELLPEKSNGFGFNTGRRRNQLIERSNNERVSRLQIRDIGVSDSGNYTCRAQNEHGSIQKWVYIAVQSRLGTTSLSTTTDPGLAPDSWKFNKKCTENTCLNAGQCRQYESNNQDKIFCDCPRGFEGERCEVNTEPASNGTDATCGGRILDCLQRTDRILTGTGIGLAVTAFLLILLLSWYMARQRKRDYSKFKDWKKNSVRYKAVQVGTPHYLRSRVRTVGCDVEHDLCVIETPPNYPYDHVSPSRSRRGADGCSACVDEEDTQALYLARSQTFPSNEYTPVGAAAAAAAASQSNSAATSYPKSATLQHPRRSCSPGATAAGGTGAHYYTNHSGHHTLHHAGYGSPQHTLSGGSSATPGFFYRPLRSVPSGESDFHQSAMMGPLSPSNESFDSHPMRRLHPQEAAQIGAQHLSDQDVDCEEFHRVGSADFGASSRRRRNYERDGTPESEIWIRRSLQQQQQHQQQQQQQQQPKKPTEMTMQIVALPPVTVRNGPVSPNAGEITYQRMPRVDSGAGPVLLQHQPRSSPYPANGSLSSFIRSSKADGASSSEASSPWNFRESVPPVLPTDVAGAVAAPGSPHPSDMNYSYYCQCEPPETDQNAGRLQELQPMNGPDNPVVSANNVNTSQQPLFANTFL